MSASLCPSLTSYIVFPIEIVLFPRLIIFYQLMWFSGHISDINYLKLQSGSSEVPQSFIVDAG